MIHSRRKPVSVIGSGRIVFAAEDYAYFDIIQRARLRNEQFE